MHRLLFFSLALVCLLAGCSAPQASDPAPDASNDLDAYFEEEPADNEMGSAEFGLQDPMDTVYTYDGESLEIPFSITGASSGKTTEIGVLLFVDGVAQPYSAVYEDGTELEESYRRSAQAQNIRQRGAAPDGGRWSIVPRSFSMTTLASPSADFLML